MPRWSVKVKQRDNWTCQKCGATAKEVGQKAIQAHHITPPLCGGENILENGITVCRKCHWEVYHPNGTRNITEKPMSKTKVTFSTPEETRKKLKQLEKETGRNLSNLMNFILDDWLSKNDESFSE